MNAELNAQLAGSLVGALVNGGVRRVVVSPGSRSTPMVLACEDHPAVETFHVLDERCAGFVGLGLARATGAPVALLCTSGSAGAHYLPALVEARAAAVPLVAMTCDRPPELHGCGAPQTIDQEHLFGRQVLAFFQVGPPQPELTPAWTRALVARALTVALGPPAGPVHLNVAFREPLWSPGVRPVRAEVEPLHVLRAGAGLRLPASLLDRVRAAERGLVVCGPRASGLSLGETGRFAHAVTTLARALGWPVLAEPASQVRHGPHDRSQVVASGDALLRDGAFAARHRPDFVLRFGGTPTGRPAQEWLAGLDAPTVLVDAGARWHDPGHQADTLVMADPTLTCQALTAEVGPTLAEPEWLHSWQRADGAAAAVLARCCSDGLWEGAVARRLTERLPDGALLHVASSMPIRDLDAFSGASAVDLRVASNRGANGIDGTLSTTWGEALAWSRGPVALLTGDLAFLHDLGGLAAGRALGAQATVFVIDNGGGGIFEYLPIAAHPTAFEPAFLTPQTASPLALARACGIPATRVETPDQLEQELEEIGALRVVEVAIDRAENVRRHAESWRAVSRALSATEVSCP